MPANVYECMFLLDTNKVGGDLQGAAKQLHGVLEKHHAEILATRPWSDGQKLAYQIDHHKKGTYYLVYFRSEGKNLRPIEHDFSLNELVLRQLTLRIHPKMVEVMLAVARDEHQTALHTANEAAESGTEEVPPMEDHSRSHRGGGRGGRRTHEHADKG